MPITKHDFENGKPFEYNGEEYFNDAGAIRPYLTTTEKVVHMVAEVYETDDNTFYWQQPIFGKMYFGHIHFNKCSLVNP